MSYLTDYLKDRKVSTVFTMIVLLVGSISYFAFGLDKQAMTEFDNSIYEDMQIKVGYRDGAIKIFALADGNSLARIKAIEGESIPYGAGMVIGNSEAMMMKNENLIQGEGDRLDGFFGLDVVVGGILPMTSSFIDQFHLMTEYQFSNIEAESGRVFLEVEGEDDVAMIMHLAIDEKLPIDLKFKEGNMESYLTYEYNGKLYYPLILGSEEAKMMREEKEFDKLGDSLDEWGNDVFVVGVLESTGTALDLMHITPLTEAEVD